MEKVVAGFCEEVIDQINRELRDGWCVKHMNTNIMNDAGVSHCYVVAVLNCYEDLNIPTRLIEEHDYATEVVS